MNYNPEPNQQLLHDHLVLERMMMLHLELQNRSDATLLHQETEGHNNLTSPTQKSKTKLNPLSIYAIATTLLLGLSFNHVQANNTVVAVDQDSDGDRIDRVEQELAESQSRMRGLELQITKSSQALAVTPTQAFPLVQPVTKFQVATTTPVSVNPIAESQQQLLPVPLPPPPPIFLNNVPPSIAPTNAIKLQQPPKPAVSNFQSIKPTPKPVSKAENNPASLVPVQQWLGQTDVVYYSSNFERDEEETKVVEVSSLTQTPITSDLSVKPVDVVNLDDLAQLEINQSTTEEASVLLNNSFVVEHLEQQQDDIQNLEVQAKSDSIDLADFNLLAKLEEDSTTKSDSLLSDEDLSRYLSSAPLLDDNVLRQRLGRTSTIAQNTESQQQDNVPKKIDLINLNLLAKLEEDSITKSDSLLSDEDLSRYLSSAPLLDDNVLRHRLGRTSIAELDLRFDSAPQEIKLTQVPSVKSSQTSLSSKKINVINLSLLDNLNDDTSAVIHETNLEEHLIVTRSSK